jgi:hypothetical protein
MCTLTIHRERGRLLVTMNRDEQRSRAPERAPDLYYHEPSGISTVSPIDSASGGTWIGASDRGVVACLLNAYQLSDNAVEAGARKSSRGAIIPEALREGGLGEVLRHARLQLPRGLYHSFHLVVASPGDAVVFHWDGVGSFTEEPLPLGWSFLTSSSWNTAEVLQWRRERFAEWQREGRAFHGEVPAIHLLQPEGREQWAPLVAREKTHTRSITQVLVDREAGEVRLRWWGSPERDLSQPGAALRLALAPE